MKITTELNYITHLADLTCDIDFANAAGERETVTSLIGEIHNTIELLLGEHAGKVYAPDEGDSHA